MEPQYGTTFTCIEDILAYYRITTKDATREVEGFARQYMKEENMCFPFTTINLWPYGSVAKRLRICPIERLVYSPAIRWLNSIPEGKTPVTWPFEQFNTSLIDHWFFFDSNLNKNIF